MWAAASLSAPSCAALHTIFHKPIKTKYFHNKDSIFTHKLLRNPRQINEPATVSVSFCATSEDSFLHPNQDFSNENKGFWQKWKENSAKMSRKVAKLGLAAVLAYGIFDGVTYTSFFVAAFLGYEKSTGNNPAANLQALLGIVILMWGGNNVTRPFRVAGAAAMAPLIDTGLRRIQKYFNFPSVTYAFGLVAGIVVGLCATAVGLLVLSRWGK
ncbi:uncharacterized protein LOC131016122 isoform X2 [Salvia miltiorrhiza]|uniref:uncharacterized protein LOC131016122 isoform X2 n=1 Tax=Salvia miltiorrhiza TaxID=226208 RepID=UPI0025ACB88F|nr:uncharacterized protein LOC131016122 isoform X2 [Salvia miltiorrhiza]